MRLPAFETIGHGRRKWRVEIVVLPLSAFQSTYRETFNEPARGPLPYAFWRDTDRKVFIRADLKPSQQLRKMKHELTHVWVDWLDLAYPDPED